jgi:hypothetical protein
VILLKILIFNISQSTPISIAPNNLSPKGDRCLIFCRGDREVLTKAHDGLRESLRLYQQRSDEVRISEARLATGGHGLSLRELVKLPLTERHRLLSPFVAEMAEDFANDPELTEFAVLDIGYCQN